MVYDYVGNTTTYVVTVMECDTMSYMIDGKEYLSGIMGLHAVPEIIKDKFGSDDAYGWKKESLEKKVQV